MSDNTTSHTRIRTIRPDHYERIRANTHVLYRCYNRKKSLLYVGMTNNPETRFRAHQADKPWWKHVYRITLMEFASRKALTEAEAAAIQLEKPKFNAVIPVGSTESVRPGRRLWPESSTFGVITPEYGHLINMTLEQQLYPCVECHAKAIYCDGDTVACGLCSSEWTYEDWFATTFGRSDTPKDGQLALM